MKTKTKCWLLAVGCWLLAFGASAQVDVTKRGITPPHNIKNHDYTQIASKFGQMLGVKKFGTSAGDTLVGFLPVYYLGDSTLKVGAYTVVHSGNVTTYAPGTDLSYTASSRLLASSTGADATLPLFTSTEAGLVPLSGGGTSNFLRADGTWAAPVGSVTSVGLSMPTGFSVSGSPVTSSGTLAVTTTLTGVVQGNGSGLTASLGTANQLLRTNAGATAAEWFTPTYLTANQTITLSGDVTGSGSTAITTTIGTGAVTSAKILDGTIAAADLSAMGASSGQVMQWNGSAWVATTPSGGITGSGTIDYFPIFTSAGVLGNSPMYKTGNILMQVFDVAGSTSFRHNNTHSAAAASAFIQVGVDAGIYLRQTLYNSLTGSSGLSAAHRGVFEASGSGGFVIAASHGSGKLILASGGIGGANARVYIHEDGLISMGTSTNNATDRLQITGSAIFSGQIKSSDGTNSSPGYTFTNDLNTGLYRPTSDVIGFTTGGTEEMRLTTTGLLIGTAGSNQGNLQLAGSTSGTVTVTTAAAAGTWTLTLPTGAGSSGQVLQTNGAGVTSWATVSATPGGSTTHVQYNNAGAFGGSANFTFDGTNVSIAQPIYAATGSNTAPSYSFTGDTNTGMYRAAADDISLAVGGSDVVRINSGGLGIGVVPSIYTLDITSTNAMRIPGGTTAQRPTAAGRLLRYNSDNETIEWNNGTTWYQAVTGTGSASRVAVWTGGLNLTNDAELGYNTTTNVLSVGGKIENAAGTAGAPTYTFTGDNTMGMYGSSGTLNWSTSGTLRMTMNTDGTTKLTSTASATNSTINTLYYNKSTSAVDDDYLTLAYNLDDSGGNETTFGQIRIISENVTNGSEGGQFAFLAQKAGTLTQLATLDATSFSLNNLTPFRTGQFTATQASAISPQNGMLIYVTSTNATFTSVGHWARENGVWVKL